MRYFEVDEYLSSYNFIIHWFANEPVNNSYVQFQVFEVVHFVDDPRCGRVYSFLEKDAASCCDVTEESEDAVCYAEGIISKDGRSYISFDGNHQYCGYGDFRKHCILMEYVYVEAGKKMNHIAEGEMEREE